MKTDGLRRFLFTAALVLGGASFGNASTLTYWVDVFGGGCSGTNNTNCLPGTVQGGFTTPPGSLPAPTTAAPNATSTLAIPQFNQATDPNPGFHYVLTQVALSLNWSATGTVSILDNTNANVSFNSASAQSNMTLQAGTAQVVALGSATQGPGTAVCCNIVNGPSYFGMTTFSGLTGTGSASQTPGNLSYFEGFGTGNVTASVATTAVSAGGSSSDPNASHLFYNGNANMGAILEVTYTYTESTNTPEPATVVLVGGALIGVGLLSRRRFAKRT